MAAPIVDIYASFAKGSYHSFCMSSEGRFNGYHHPEGTALRVSDSDIIATNRSYLEVREHNAPGSCRGFYCALRESSFDDLPIGEEYECTFVLVLGVSPNNNTSIMQIHYYKWKAAGICPYNSLTQAVEGNTQRRFAMCMFEPTLISADYDTVYVKHLAQVSGPTFEDQRPFIIATVDVKVFDEESGEYFEEERTYHETPTFGDCVSYNGGAWIINSEQEREKNMIRAPSTIDNLDQILSRTECNDDVAQASATSNITQFGHNSPNTSNTRVRIIYTKRRDPIRNAERLFMIPLPNSPQGYQDFAAVTRKQKKMIDRILLKQAKKRTHLLSPQVMRDWLEKFSLDNCGESYRRMHDMESGEKYHGYVCLLHIVSIVKDFDKVQKLQDVVKLDENTYVQYVSSNVQDPHVLGTVVFRGYPLGKDLTDFNHNHIDLIHTTYPKRGMKRKVTDNSGFFGMFSTRQGSQNNRSMGQVSSGYLHGYYDAAQCNETLASHLYPTISAMATVTRDVQLASGQVEIGTIEAAYRQGGDLDISSINICPYNICTGAKVDTRYKVKESFANCYHDDGDTLNKEQTKKVMDYVDNSNCPLLAEHLRTKQETFKDKKNKDKKNSDRIHLPSTCAWKQRERPEDYSYIHHQHFIVAEAGMSYNLSSYVYDNLQHYIDNPTQNIILGSTFFGSLIGHLTSTSMYEVVGGQGATTIMPGDAALQAWGSSGGYAYLGIRTGARQTTRIIQTIHNYHQTHGQFPRRLTQVSLDEYLIMGGHNGRIPQGWLPTIQNQVDEVVAGRGVAGRGRRRGGGRGRGRGRVRGRGRGRGRGSGRGRG